MGHIVSEYGIYPDPQKNEAVEKLSAPRNAKEIRHALSNYYQQFICDNVKVAESLYKLAQKSSLPFQLDVILPECIFLLKQFLTTAPILAYPDFTLPFVLYTDAPDIHVAV